MRCWDLCVPGCSPLSAFSLIRPTFLGCEPGWQSSLRLQEWKERAINMQSIYYSCRTATPCSRGHPSVLLWHFLHVPRELPLKTPSSLPWKGLVLFLLFFQWPSFAFWGQEHGFQGKILKQASVLILYQKLSRIMESLVGLSRSWTVAWALTAAAVYCVPSGGIPVHWGHLTLCRYFEAVCEVEMLKDLPQGLLQLLTDGQDTGVTHGGFFSPQKLD